MKRFVVTLETLSPLAIRADHAQGGAVTTQYISGTTLLGSLASAHRFMRSDQTDEFADLFLNDAVQYPNLYPAMFEDEGIQNAGTPVYPLPKTAQTCKRFTGFKFLSTDVEEERRHGARDTLIDWALFSIASDAAKKLDIMRHYKDCRECGASMDHFSGYYRRGESDSKSIMSSKVETRLQTHTGINRRTGTVQQSILYNREVLEEGMQFQGIVNLPNELAQPFQDFVESVGRDGLVRVGTGRTRGMGKVVVGVKAINDGQDTSNTQNTFEGFKDRLQAFNNQLHAQVRQFDITIPERMYIAVTLHSPAIIRDGVLRYEGTLTAERLARLTGMPGDTFERVYQSASTRRMTGWNELWGTPKANDYAIETGSVFLFSYLSKADDDDHLLRALHELEERGLGQRRAEGFGRICVSDPFHREVVML